MRAALLCLLPLMQGMIVSISTEHSASAPPFNLDIVEPLTGNFTEIAYLNPIPGASVFRDANTVIFSTVLLHANPLGSYLTTLDLPTGKTQQGPSYPNLWFTSLEIDKVTKQTFVFAVNLTANITAMYELLPDQTLRQMVELPGDYGFLNAYSSSKHIFFVFTTTTTREESSNVLAVDTAGQGGKLLYNVSVGFSIQSMVYDDTAGVLYVWGTNSTRTAFLASVDYTTGKTLRTFSPSTILTAGPVCINNEGTIIYSALAHKPNDRSVIHSLELSSGKSTQVPASRFPITLNFQ